MKRVYQDPLNECIRAGIQAELPQFTELKQRLERLPAATRIFVWRASPALSCYIAVIPHPGGKESFYVSVGWSDGVQTPFEIDWKEHFNLLAPKDILKKEAVHFGVQRLWGSQGDGEYQLQTPWTGFDADREGDEGFLRRFNEEKALKKEDTREWVQSAVAKAISDIKAYVVPFLDELLAARRG